MNRQVPTLARLVTMVLFALSCFGLILFLWLQFGGPVPFKSQGYRIQTSFPEATSLATEADVRIAGVRIGRVKEITQGQNGRSDVVFEVDPRFAPLPQGTQAVLRQKTLLGETYVALTPPTQGTAQDIPEGGSIPVSDVGETVELDELFSAFDPDTRAAFQRWMQEGGAGLNGQGENAGLAFGEFQVLVSELKTLSGSLNDQTPQLRTLLGDGAEVLNAATEQRGALEGAIRETERVFRQTADQDAALTAFVERLPRFLEATRTGTTSLADFAQETGPAVERLQPTAEALSPAARRLADAAPVLEQLLVGVERAAQNGREGLPAAERTLAALPEILDPLDPFLKQLNPILAYGSLYSDGIAASLGNVAAATQGQTPPNVAEPEATVVYRDGKPLRVVRGALVLQNNGLTASTTRLSTDQANPYPNTGFAGQIGNAALADVYSAQSCGTTVPNIPDNDNPTLSTLESATPSTINNPPVPDVSLTDALRYGLYDPYGFFAPDKTTATPSRPAPTGPQTAPRTCTVQAPFTLTTGSVTTYPQLPEAPSSTSSPLTGVPGS